MIMGGNTGSMDKKENPLYENLSEIATDNILCVSFQAF